MGTRSMVIVKDRSGEVKIAKYNQWDGYLAGVGKDLLKFLSEHPDFEKHLEKLRFLESEFDKDFIKRFNNKPTKKDTVWYDSFVSRDLGVKLLYNIVNHKKNGLALVDQSENLGYVSYQYTIDYSLDLFKIEDFYNEKEYTFSLSNLPKEGDEAFKLFIEE